MISIRLRASLLAGAAALTLAACGGVDSEDVKNDVSAQVEQATGSKPENLECPDLEGEEGKSVTCTGDVDGTAFEAKVTVTEVTDDQARYEVELTEVEE